MKCSKLYPDNLFLLEFLVEKIEIYPKALPVDLRNQKGVICLSLLFFDNGPLDICEEDFDPVSGCLPCTRPRNGKSCLFALEPRAAKSAMKEFDIDIIAYKVLENKEEDRLRIGETSISIAKEFSQVVKKSWQNGICNPITETHICNASLQGAIPCGGCCIGDVNIFIRISCFGKTIVTQIQMNEEDNSVYFKDKDGKALYKYVKKPGSRSKDDLSEICDPTPCTSYGLQDLPCPSKPCKIPPSCFPECKLTVPCCPLPPCAPPCSSSFPPCGFPRKFNICGSPPACEPICGLPPGSKVYYLNPCAPPYSPCPPCSPYPPCPPCPPDKEVPSKEPPKEPPKKPKPTSALKKGQKKGKKK